MDVFVGCRCVAADVAGRNLCTLPYGHQVCAVNIAVKLWVTILRLPIIGTQYSIIDLSYGRCYA